MCLPVCLCVCSRTRLTGVCPGLTPGCAPAAAIIFSDGTDTGARPGRETVHSRKMWTDTRVEVCGFKWCVVLRWERLFILPQCSQSGLHFLLFDTTRSAFPAPLELLQYIKERRGKKKKHILCIFTLLVNETMALFCIYKYVDSLTAYNNQFSPLLSVSPQTFGHLKRDFVRCFDSSSLGVWHFAFYLLCHHVWPRGI